MTKPCRYAGCPNGTGGRAYCREHAERRRRLYDRLRAVRHLTGTCVRCGKARRDAGRKTCHTCRAKWNDYSNVSRNKAARVRRLQCRCVICKVQLRDGAFVKCLDCRVAHAAAVRRGQAARKAAGRCPRCGGERENGRVSCERCREARKKYGRKT